MIHKKIVAGGNLVINEELVSLTRIKYFKNKRYIIKILKTIPCKSFEVIFVFTRFKCYLLLLMSKI